MTDPGPAPRRPAPPRGVPALGTRVVLRHRLPSGYSRSVTDVIGELVSLAPAVAVRTADGRVVQVAPSEVVALRAIGARPVRTSEIRALETAAAAGRPGFDQAWVDGWLVRAGAGVGDEDDCAVPIGAPGTVADPSEPRVAAGLRAWFAERGLPVTLCVPDRLASVPTGVRLDGGSRRELVLAADLDAVPLPDGPTPVEVTAAPDGTWLDAWPPARLSPDVASVVGTVADGLLGFGRIGAPASVAIGRAAVTTAPDARVWVGLSCLHVHPDHRRHGLGTLVAGSLARWGRDMGATHAYAAVPADDTGTRTLLTDLGFVDHHHRRIVRLA